jgi:hypothetical protein
MPIRAAMILPVDLDRSVFCAQVEVKKLLSAPASAPRSANRHAGDSTLLSPTSVMRGVVAEATFPPASAPKQGSMSVATAPPVSGSAPSAKNQMAPTNGTAPVHVAAGVASSAGPVQEEVLDLGGGSLALRIIRLTKMLNTGKISKERHERELKRLLRVRAFGCPVLDTPDARCRLSACPPPRTLNRMGGTYRGWGCAGQLRAGQGHHRGSRVDVQRVRAWLRTRRAGLELPRL